MMLAFALCLAGCADKKTSTQNENKEVPGASVAAAEPEPEANPYLEQYPKVPEASDYFTAGPVGQVVYAELRIRYKEHLLQLKKDVEATGAKFVVLLLTPDTGPQMSQQARVGIPIIRAVCKEISATLIDLTPALSRYTPEQKTQVPNDGHWSKQGSQIVASEIARYLPEYASAKATVHYDDKQRPTLFGDLDPGSDQVLDGGKNLPYHVVTNKQGLRMNNEISFPKAKQRIVFLGDSQVYSPFLDNEFIFTNLLQQKFPDKEIINNSAIGYTIDDLVYLFETKAKYLEPDVVIAGTNPEDITDFFFSNKNKFNNSHKAFAPSSNEKKFYEQLFGKK